LWLQSKIVDLGRMTLKTYPPQRFSHLKVIADIAKRDHQYKKIPNNVYI
jgi:hypothetical protein